MNPLSLNISNLHLQVRLRDLRPAILQEVARAFAPFVGPNGETPHETLEVVKLRVPRRRESIPALEAFIKECLRIPLGKFPFPAKPEKQIENALDDLRDFYGDSRFRLFFQVGENPGEVLIYLLDRGCLLRRPQVAGSLLFLKTGCFRRPKVASICEAIHVSTSMALPLVDGVMLHGVGIRKGETGYLFLGLSDSGKSTLARFSPPEEVISDDGIIVQRAGADFYLVHAPIDQSSRIRGVPKRSPSRKTRISMGFLLEKDSKVYLEKLAPSEVSSIILKNHIHYFRYFPSGSVRKTFSLISDLCRQVPLYRLHFKKDPSFWSSIELEMSGNTPGRGGSDGYKREGQEAPLRTSKDL